MKYVRWVLIDVRIKVPLFIKLPAKQKMHCPVPIIKNTEYLQIYQSISTYECTRIRLHCWGHAVCIVMLLLSTDGGGASQLLFLHICE